MEHVSNALASISEWGLQQWAIVAAASLSVYAIKRYYNGGVCHERRDLTNQVVVITGANRGIGFETAVALADMNATVVLACRSGPAVDKAIQAIRARTPRGVVTNVSLDLASLDSVRECVKELVKRYASIDILINNAGVMACPEWRTEDGHEYQVLSLSPLLREGRLSHIHALARCVCVWVVRRQPPGPLLSDQQAPGIVGDAVARTTDASRGRVVAGAEARHVGL